MTASALREPSELYAPDEITEDMLEIVAQNLTPKGWASFTSDLSKALAESRTSNDLRPLNVTIEAWYRTFIFMGRRQFHEACKSEPPAETPLSLEDIRLRRAQRFA